MKRILRLFMMLIMSTIIVFGVVAGAVYYFRGAELPYKAELVPPLPDTTDAAMDTVMTEEQMAAVAESLRVVAVDSQLMLLTMAETRVNTQRDSINLIKQQIDVGLRQLALQQQADVVQLTRVFEAMAPDAAAAIIEDMDDRIVLALLANMGERQAARIMGALPPDRAIEISERIGRQP